MFPEWYPIIEHKLKTHIECLVARYRISSHSVEDIFNEVIANMINAENNGSTIKFPLAYSKLAARNLVVKLQQDEYKERGMELILLRERAVSFVTEAYDQSCEDGDLLCTILLSFRKQHPRHHQFIVLRDLEQLDYDLIASLFNISYDAVRQSYSRARRQFLTFARDYVSKQLDYDLIASLFNMSYDAVRQAYSRAPPGILWSKFSKMSTKNGAWN